MDPKRIGLWGGSYGGYLVALGLARASQMFAAGVDLHGVHDWRTETRVFLPSDELPVQQEALRVALDSSPMGHVKGWRSPVLLVHGTADQICNCGGSQDSTCRRRRQRTCEGLRWTAVRSVRPRPIQMLIPRDALTGRT